ncbi:MAG: hypothetical protein AAGI50_16925 [Pseudomonadota bacterium]
MRSNSFRLKWRAGSVALEGALVLPVALLLFAAAAQYHAFASARVFTEQAAYAAAQSALVYLCPEPAERSPGAVLGALDCDDEAERWRNAARWALVPAAPSSGQGGFGSDCDASAPGSDALAAAGLPGSYDPALRNRLCYVHGAGTVEVEAVWIDTPTARPGDPVFRAVRATVRFQAPITAPIGRLFSDGQHADGLPWAWSTAEVVLS